MSRLCIQDETGAAERFSIDQSKYVSIGAGDGVDRLTILGVAFLQGSGIMDGSRIPSAALVPTTGSVSVPPNHGTAAISTSVGHTPFVTAEQGGGATQRISAGSPAVCTTTTTGTPQTSVVSLSSTGFSIQYDDYSNGGACAAFTLNQTVNYAYA